MGDAAADPIVLTTVDSEAEAAMIVAALESEGVDAHATGGLTSGFRAEVPGGVHVLVRSADEDAARKILDELRSSDEEVPGEK